MNQSQITGRSIPAVVIRGVLIHIERITSGFICSKIEKKTLDGKCDRHDSNVDDLLVLGETCLKTCDA